MNTPAIEATFHAWWLDSYKRPPTAQATMTHVAFAKHVLTTLRRTVLEGEA